MGEHAYTPEPASDSDHRRPDTNSHQAQPHHIVQMQRKYGNRATRRYIENRIQRDDDDENRTWRPPRVFELEQNDITARADAGMALYQMVESMIRLRNELPEDRRESISNSISTGTRLIREITGEGDLTVDQVNQLRIFSSFAASATSGAISYIQSTVQPDLEPLKEVPNMDRLNTLKGKLAEKLHSAFMSGDTDSDLSDIQEAYNGILDYKTWSLRVADWARYISSIFGRNRVRGFLEAFNTRTQRLSTVLDRLDNVLTAASSIQHVFQIRGTEGAQADIARFRDHLEVANAASAFFEAVPLLGTLWSNYYMPMTTAILDTLDRVFALRELDARRQALADMSGQSRGDLAPLIPHRMEALFPGGQHVLNFMFAVMNNGDPHVTSAIESFFIQHVPQFNAAQEEDDLEVETNRELLSPSTWLDPEESLPHLLEWVTRNRQTVWAQLYGDIPPDFVIHEGTTISGG